MPGTGVAEESSLDIQPKAAWLEDVEETQDEPQQHLRQRTPTRPARAAKAQPAVADKISLSRRILFSAPTAATLPFVAMWSIYGTRSYSAFGAPLAVIALFTALARSLDVVSDPLVSNLTDTVRPDPPWLPHWLQGRRKPFMFVGCFFYSIFLFSLLNPPYTTEYMLALWFGTFYTLYFLANTLTCIPYDALGPELSENSDERTGLFFVSNLFDGGGTLIALGLPILGTAFSEGIWRERNADICVSDTSRSRECLAGRSCMDFLVKGHAAAYVLDPVLRSTLANVSNATTTMDPARDCIDFLRVCPNCPTNTTVILPSATFAQNEAFCKCMGVCADSCSVANKRTGFMLVGSLFASWFILTMCTLVWRVPERRLSVRQRPPRLVPSLRNALNNRPFCVLLPAWLCDAFVNAIVQSLVPFFVEGVVAPAYQTMEENGRDCYKSSEDYRKDGRAWTGEAGRRDSDAYDIFCDTDSVMAIAGILLLTSAILFLPIWKFLVFKLGKVKTWLLWTLTMAVTNLVFVFLPRGAIYALWAAAALNGAPLGAKFLADAILADIIDYDEFRTGVRSEASYAMFKSFLPKIVQIPAAAVPIALLGTFGYVPPKAGKVQDQPKSVSIYLRIVIGLGFVTSLIAYFIKRRYPLRDDRVELLAHSRQLHKQDKWATDPVTGLKFKPLSVPDEEKELVQLLCHFSYFSAGRIRETFKGTLPVADEDVQGRLCKLCARISTSSVGEWVAAVCFLVAACMATWYTYDLLWSERLQFLPTICVVLVGVGVAAVAFTTIRWCASRQLRRLLFKQTDNVVEVVQHLLGYQQMLEFYGHVGKSPDPLEHSWRHIQVRSPTPPSSESHEPQGEETVQEDQGLGVQKATSEGDGDGRAPQGQSHCPMSYDKTLD